MSTPEQDLLLFKQLLENENKPQPAPPDIVSLSPYDIQADKGAFGAVIGVLGIAANFLPPLKLAVMGASLAFTLLGNKEDKQKRAKKYEQTYTFTSGSDQLAPLGAPIPLIYCNRKANKSGGTRFSGFLIASYVETKKGSGVLNQLYALGLGELGEVDVSNMLVNNQPQSQFYSGEIKVTTRSGLPSSYNLSSQTTPSAFPFFVQCVSPQSYATLGCDKRAEVENSTSSIKAGFVPWSSLSNCYLAGNILIKNAGGDNYNASALSTTGISSGEAMFSFKANDADSVKMVGLSNTNAIENMPFAIELKEGGIITIREDGATKYSTPITPPQLDKMYKANDLLKIEISNTGVVTYLVNDTLLYTSLNTVNYPLYPAALLYTMSSSPIREAKLIAQSIIVAGSSTSTGLGITTIDLDESEEENYGTYDRFNPSDTYAIVNDSGYQEFRVVEKPTLDNEQYVKQLRVSPPIDVSSGDEIYAIYKVKYESTKRVSELHLNMSAIVFSRPKPNSEENESGK